jgi:hypothetical protein
LPKAPDRVLQHQPLLPGAGARRELVVRERDRALQLIQQRDPHEGFRPLLYIVVEQRRDTVDEHGLQEHAQRRRVTTLVLGHDLPGQPQR